MIIRKTHQRIRVCFLCLFLVFTMLLTVGAVREFVKDAEQFDDMTMLCLAYHPDLLE